MNMEEKIIIIAKTSASSVEKSSTNTKRQSLMGVLMPLVAPICVFLYMLTEDVQFGELSGFAKFLVLGGVAIALFLYACHKKAVEMADEKVKEAETVTKEQSLVVTNQRIYGNIGQKMFSYEYSDIVKAYSTMVQGSYSKLVIKVCSNEILEFRYVENLQTVISCINDTKKNNEKTNNTVIIEKEEDIKVDKIEEAVAQELYDIAISSAEGSMQQIKVLRQITFFDLATAKNVFSKLPYTIAKSQEKEVAESMKIQLERTGMKITLTRL